MINKNVFRIAMIVYSQSEGIKNKNVVIKKIIEAIFLERENDLLTITEIISNAYELVKMSILEDEVIEIVEESKNKKYFIKDIEEGTVKYKLSDKRYIELSKRMSKNIGEYIVKFVHDNNLDEKIEDAIYRYLYLLFQSGINELQSVLAGKSINEEKINEDFSSDEIKYINLFLEWKDKCKNEALVALLGYTLEYSMLTCNVDALYGTRLGQIFSNKNLYIDTNIIYYCIGINGEEYQKANERLLEMCKRCNEKLIITTYTETEFNNTLRHYIEEIQNYESPSLNSISYSKYMSNQDIYLYYLNWKKTRKKYKSVIYFEKYILDKYREWKNKYKIIIDDKQPFKEDDPRIEQYVQEIQYKGKVNYDALNILWVEAKREKRGQKNSSFCDAQYLLISPHKVLQRWDMSRNSNTKIVVSPKTWMLLLHKFVTRSDDDYQSFISFINIKVPTEMSVNNKTFYMIVKAIEEVTDDIEQQESIIDVLVEENFSYLRQDENEAEITTEEIQNKTREKATVLLQEEMNILKNDIEDMKKTQEVFQKSSAESNVKIKTLDQMVKDERTKNEQLIKNKNVILMKYLNTKLIIRRTFSILIMLVVTTPVAWQLYDIFIKKNSNGMFIVFIKKCVNNTIFQSENIANIVASVGALVISVVLVKIDWTLLKIFINEDYIERYMNKLRDKFE